MAESSCAYWDWNRITAALRTQYLTLMFTYIIHRRTFAVEEYMEEAHLLWCRLIWLQSTSHSPAPSWHSDNGYPLFTWRHMFAFTWGWGHIMRQNKSIAFSSQSRKSANLFLQSSELGLPQLLTRMRVGPPPPSSGWRGRLLKYSYFVIILL